MNVVAGGTLPVGSLSPLGRAPPASSPFFADLDRGVWSCTRERSIARSDTSGWYPGYARPMVQPTSTRVVVAAVLWAGALAVAAPGSEPVRRQVTLLLTAGTSGRLVDTDGNSAAGLTATIRSLAAADQAAGHDVVVLDAGRTLAPYAESRYDRGETAMGLLAASGCVAFAPDPIDFALGRERLEELAAHAPFPVLSPVDGPSDLAERATLDLGDGLTLELESVADPAFAGDLAAAGFDSAPRSVPGERTGDAVRVVIAHSHGRGDSLSSRQLTWGLVERGESIDLLVDPDLGHDLTLRRECDGGPILLVGRRQRRDQPWTVARVVLELERSGDSWQPVSAESTVHGVDPGLAPDPAVEAEVRAAFDRFRAAYSAPLPPAAPANRAELEQFVLAAMREAARAEVAALNRGALRPVAAAIMDQRPLPQEAILRLLSFDQELVTLELTGSRVLALAQESAVRVGDDGQPRRDGLYLLGVEPTVEGAGTAAAKVTGATVNGRPLRPDDLYSVVTTRYLAAGGDGYATLVEGAGVPLRQPDGRAVELREDAVLPRLASADVPFPDLARRPLWRWGADRLGLVFDGVRTSHDSAYSSSGDSRARAEDSASFLGEARLRLDRDVLPWRWENRFRARFGLLTAEGADTREVDDDAVLDSSVVLNRSRLLGGSPYAGVTVDTEFRPPADEDGDSLPRQLEESLAFGVTWSARLWPRLRLGLVGRHYAHTDRQDQIGVSAELSFLLKPQGRRLGLDSRLLLEALADSETSTSKADLDLRLLVPLYGGLALAPGFNAYLLDDSTRPGVAIYTRLSLALVWLWQDKHQRW